MSGPYPVLPTPLALFDTLTGVFDPVAGAPALENGVGTIGQRYVVTRAGDWDFVTGTGGSGTALLAGDEVIYVGGVWEKIWKGSLGDFLLRDGTLPLTGPLDTDGHTILLREGLIQGTSGTVRALVRFVDLAAGTWATRQSLVQIRARVSGDPSSVPLLSGELAADILQALPTLLVGINGAGDVAVLVGPTRQVELSGNQTAAGIKTFRALRFGASGQEMALPTTRGAEGDALVLGAGGDIAWGGVQLSANAASIALPDGGGTVVAALNAAGPFVIGPSDLVFITWEDSVYVWSGGPGTFGTGATAAEVDDIVGPVLSFSGIAFANLGEVQAGAVTGKAIDPAVGAAAFLVKDSEASQSILSDLIFSGLGVIQAAWRLVSGATLDIEAGAKLTIQDAPRAGAPGTKDAVNRTALDGRFQATSAATGAGNAGKGVILDGAGKVDRAVLPMTVPVDFHGLWSPNAPGTNLLRNVSGGGCTPAVQPGTLFLVSSDARWNFATGALDPSGTALAAGMQLLFDASFAWLIAASTAGGGSSAALPRDGSLPMTGNLSFQAGLKLSGAASAQPVTAENIVIDGGVI